MTMKSKLTAIVISALTLTATASDHHDEKKGPKAKPAKAEGKRKLPTHMAKFDKNKDGKLCEAERKVAAAARQKMLLKKFDKERSTYDKLMSDPESLENMLCEGEKKASKIAQSVLARVKDKIGF